VFKAYKTDSLHNYHHAAKYGCRFVWCVNLRGLAGLAPCECLRLIVRGGWRINGARGVTCFWIFAFFAACLTALCSYPERAIEIYQQLKAHGQKAHIEELEFDSVWDEVVHFFSVRGFQVGLSVRM
jgi:hypothetical protein